MRKIFLLACFLAAAVAGWSQTEAEVVANCSNYLRQTGQERMANPPAPADFYRAAYAFMCAGMYEDALPAYEIGVSKDPAPRIDAQAMLLFLKAEPGKESEAIAALQELGLKNQRNVYPRMNIGRLLYQTGKLEESLGVWKALRTEKLADPAFLELDFYVSMILIELNRPAEARPWLQRYVDLNHSFEEARITEYFIPFESMAEAESILAGLPQ